MKNNWQLSLSMLVAILAATPISAGEFAGTVRYEGEAVQEDVQVSSDQSVCGQIIRKATINLGEKGGLHDAVVWLDGVNAQAAEAVQIPLGQENCRFDPFLSLAPKGSTLTISSSDSVLHNVHGIWDEGGEGTAFNVAVPIPGFEIPVELKEPGRLRLKCDAGHAWMEAYIVVQDHPFYAVTADDGSFGWSDAPEGEYVLHVWHPTLGTLEQTVKVPGNVTLTYPVQ